LIDLLVSSKLKEIDIVLFTAERTRDVRLIPRRFGGRKTIYPTTGGFRAFVAIAAVVPALFALVAPGFASAKAKRHVTLVASGSSAAQPYMLALFSKYSKLHPEIRFSYNPDGGSAGVTDVQAGRSQFAIQTAAPVASNTGTHFYKLFLDALCIDVNSSNSTGNLSINAVRNIFLGVDTDWSQVGGGGSGTIAPYGRNATAGLFTYFKSAVLAGRSQASNVTQLASDGLVANAIAKDKSGIGYVGLSHSTTSGQKPVQIDGASCTAANVRNGSYQLTHWDWAVLPLSHPNTQVVQFVNWVETSKVAGKIANRAGAVWKKL
jgi:phosphate transport system substrate-binding protein